MFRDKQTLSCLGRVVEGLSGLLLPVLVFGFLSLLPCPNLLSVQRWLVHAHTLRLFLYSLKVQCQRNKPLIICV